MCVLKIPLIERLLFLWFLQQRVYASAKNSAIEVRKLIRMSNSARSKSLSILLLGQTSMWKDWSQLEPVHGQMSLWGWAPRWQQGWCKANAHITPLEALRGFGSLEKHSLLCAMVKSSKCGRRLSLGTVGTQVQRGDAQVSAGLHSLSGSWNTQDFSGFCSEDVSG